MLCQTSGFEALYVYVHINYAHAQEHVEASYDPIIDKSFTDGEIDEGKEQAEGPTVALDLTQKFEEAVSDEEAMGSNDEQVPCKAYPVWAYILCWKFFKPSWYVARMWWLFQV